MEWTWVWERALKETSIVKTDVELDFHGFLVGNRKNIGLQKEKKREIFMQQRRKSPLSHWKRYVTASGKVSILCPRTSGGVENKCRHFWYGVPRTLMIQLLIIAEQALIYFYGYLKFFLLSVFPASM